MRLIKIIVLHLILCHKCGDSTDYCKLCVNGSHTLCKYPHEGPAPSCVGYGRTELSPATKKYILDIHNDIRNHVASGEETKGALGRQPAAANMFLMMWDTELAEIAQRWADQCIQLNQVQHDVCKRTEKFDVGQNVLTVVTTTMEVPDLAVLVLNWYNQVSNVIPTDLDRFYGVIRGKFFIGQYTQLVWANTHFIGCGIATFRNLDKSPKKSDQYLHRFVCNYGPAGNVMGASVYERGPPCSKCGEARCDIQRPNLCQGVDKERRKGVGKRSVFLNSSKGDSVAMILRKIQKTEDNTNNGNAETDAETKDFYYVTENEIVFQNRTHLKKERGIWQNGHCRSLNQTERRKSLRTEQDERLVDQLWLDKGKRFWKTTKTLNDGDECFCLFKLD